jgi:hypothetical protein
LNLRIVEFAMTPLWDQAVTLNFDVRKDAALPKSLRSAKADAGGRTCPLCNSEDAGRPWKVWWDAVPYLRDLLFSQWKRAILPVGNPIGHMSGKNEVLK